MAMPRIVVGTDFSEGSKRALRAVEALSKGFRPELHLVHAFPPGAHRLPTRLRQEVGRAVAHAEIDEARHLTRIAEALRRRGFDVIPHAEEGKAVERILHHAKARKAGMIAVGTSGRKGIEGIFLGSVAERVLRDSPVPVLVTPSLHQGKIRYGPVLAAIDLGPSSLNVLRAAAGLAKDLGVSIVALHCIAIPYIGGAFPEGSFSLSPEALREAERNAAIEMTKLCQKAAVGVDIVPYVGLGDTATHVTSQARHVRASVIVTGRRKPGRRLGSVSAGLVHLADRPILMVPAEFKAESKAMRFAAAGG